MKKDILEKLCPPDEAELEKLAESSPATDDKTKKSIVEACLRKYGAYGDSVEGAEKYRRPSRVWAAAAAAALVLAAAGGIAAVRLNRSAKGVGIAPEPETQSSSAAPAASDDAEPRSEETSPAGDVKEERETAPDRTEEAENASGAAEEATSGEEAPADVSATDPEKGQATRENCYDQQEIASCPPQSPAEKTEEEPQSATDPWVIHLPCNAYLPYGYWSSTGVHGNMNWEFFAGKAQTSPDEACGGRGSCYKDGYYVGSFGYSSVGDVICIQMDDGTFMKGTISGMVESPSSPFQITWDTGGTDYFTNSKEPFPYYPVEPNDQTKQEPISQKPDVPIAANPYQTYK